MKISPI